MTRKLAFALTLISLSFSGVVFALGLGEVKVQSNLNQPLKARIQLTNVGGLTEAEILPGLATREEFIRAGVDRVYFLSDIRFSVEKSASGDPVVVLTTKKPVREPFLNFLVEVIWPSGRLLREYALLIDPPLFAEDKVVAARAAPSVAVSNAAQPEPFSTAGAESAQKGDNLSVASVSPARGSKASDQTYGATTSKDTLWNIALDVRPDRSVSPQQVMLAIQDLNPDAFIDDNINKLKAGQVLRLPSESQIKNRSASQAINEVIAQNSALRKPRTKSLTSAAKQNKNAPTTAKKNAGDELKLVVSDKDSKASDSAGSDPSGISEAGSAANDEELAITLEKLDKANLENQELSGKMKSLEEQLNTLQRLLTLKNDQLAGLQSQMRANDIAEAEAEQSSGSEAVSEEVEEPLSDTLEMKAVVESQSDMSGEDAVVTQEVVVSETVVDTKLLNKDSEVVAEKVEVSKTVELKSAGNASKDKQLSFQDQLFESLMNNPLYQAGAAVVLVLLLIILLVLSRRSASKESETASETDEVVSAEEDLSELETEGSEDDSIEELEEADAEDLVDEVASDDSEKEDVIAEADVYIAYGRLDQAATILEQGISADPVRVDYRLKLLTVYKDALEQDAFDRQYSELEAIQDEDALSKASEIRQDLMSALEEKALRRPLSDDADVEHLLDEDEAQALMQGDDNNFDFDTVDEGSTTADQDEPSAEIVAEVEEELEGELDLESEELDIDLDIDLDLDEADAVADEELSSLEGLGSNLDSDLDAGVDSDLDSGIDFESALSDADAALDASDEDKNSAVVEELGDSASDADLLDLELGDDFDLTLAEEEGIDSALSDIDLSGELEQESEIDLSTELDAGDGLEGLELADDAESLESDLGLDLGDESSLEDALEFETDSASADDLALDNDTPDASLLDLGDDDDLVVTDETLEDAAEALGDADNFEPELSENEDFDFLEGTDEASTKLDLARAYIDMGDIDGAKEILAEVEQEGSPEQQAQAKDLIASVGG